MKKNVTKLFFILATLASSTIYADCPKSETLKLAEKNIVLGNDEHGIEWRSMENGFAAAPGVTFDEVKKGLKFYLLDASQQSYDTQTDIAIASKVSCYYMAKAKDDDDGFYYDIARVTLQPPQSPSGTIPNNRTIQIKLKDIGVIWGADKLPENKINIFCGGDQKFEKITPGDCHFTLGK